MDINSATKEELETLPGIGPATSQRIVEGRPYKAKSDLTKRKIVSQSEYEKIKDNVVAHQTTTTSECPASLTRSLRFDSRFLPVHRQNSARL
jgi:predicted DNA-binding helix-hairpin-helix protein